QLRVVALRQAHMVARVRADFHAAGTPGMQLLDRHHRLLDAESRGIPQVVPADAAVDDITGCTEAMPLQHRHCILEVVDITIIEGDGGDAAAFLAAEVWHRIAHRHASPAEAIQQTHLCGKCGGRDVQTTPARMQRVGRFGHVVVHQDWNRHATPLWKRDGSSPATQSAVLIRAYIQPGQPVIPGLPALLRAEPGMTTLLVIHKYAPY